MTKREKLRILKAMRVRLAERKKLKYCGFLCGCYRKVKRLQKMPHSDALLKLGITRPRGYKRYDGWWPVFDYASRLRALNKAIRKLEPKK